MKISDAWNKDCHSPKPQREVLCLVHEGHQGIVKMKNWL